MEFAEFNFKKHMLQRLYTLSPGRFDIVVVEMLWKCRRRVVGAYADVAG